MNKSEILRTLGRILMFFPLFFLLSVPAFFKIILLLIWFIALIFYSYPAILASVAFLSYQKLGKDHYIKLMKTAFASGRLNPKSAATYSYVLLKDGEIDLASDVLDYAELTAYDRKKWRKGEVQYNHVHSYRALVLWKQNRLDAAAQLLINLLDSGYKTSILYANLGWFLIKQKKYSEALKLNLTALDYDRSNAILDNLGLCYLLTGDLEKSREYYDELMGKNPDFPDAWFNFGTLLDAEGNSDEAQKMYGKALTCKFSSLGTITREEIEEAIQK